MIKQFWTGDPGDTTKHLGEWKPTRDLLPAFPVGVSEGAKQRGAATSDAIQGVLTDLRSRTTELRGSTHYTEPGKMSEAFKLVQKAESLVQATTAAQRNKARDRAAEIGKEIFSPVRRHLFSPPAEYRKGSGVSNGRYYESDEARLAVRGEVWRRLEKIADPLERENFIRTAVEAGDGLVISAIEQLPESLGGPGDEMRDAMRLHFAATWYPEKHAEWTDEMRMMAHLDALDRSAGEAMVDIAKKALPETMHRRVDEAVALANAQEAGADAG